MINRNKKVLSIVGLIVVGCIGSAMWEMVIRPGAYRFWESIGNILDFNMRKAVDASYSSAALNPYPLPSLVLLLTVGVVGAGILFSTVVVALIDRIRARQKVDGIVQHATDSLIMRRFFKYVLKPIVVIIAIYGVILIYGSLFVVNHAIFTRRLFETNLKIIAPFTSEKDIYSLRSDFSRVKNREDFIHVYKRMQNIAEQNSVELRKEKTW